MFLGASLALGPGAPSLDAHFEDSARTAFALDLAAVGSPVAQTQALAEDLREDLAALFRGATVLQAAILSLAGSPFATLIAGLRRLIATQQAMLEYFASAIRAFDL